MTFQRSNDEDGVPKSYQHGYGSIQTTTLTNKVVGLVESKIDLENRNTNVSSSFRRYYFYKIPVFVLLFIVVIGIYCVQFNVSSSSLLVGMVSSPTSWYQSLSSDFENDVGSSEHYHNNYPLLKKSKEQDDDDSTITMATDGKNDNNYEYRYFYKNRHSKEKRKIKKFITSQALYGLQLQLGYPSVDVQMEYAQDVQDIHWNDVRRDLHQLITNTSYDWWPADYGTYGPLFIRLAWHSCGSYRTSDGRGGWYVSMNPK